jgi:ankyrin repeat protein
MLLQHDPTLIHSRTNYNNETPLHIAARTSAAMVRFLYDRQADPTLGSGESHAGTLSLGFSMSSITPLGAFINEGLVQTRGEMLSTIMDVSRDSGFVAMKQEGGHHFKGAIHMAAICSSQHPERSHSVHETLRLLLEDDELWIQINQKDSGNRTPLFLACFDGGLAAARILLEAGADPRITYYDRFTEHTFDCCK